MNEELRREIAEAIADMMDMKELGLVVVSPNGLGGMAEGPEWYFVPLCNDGPELV